MRESDIRKALKKRVEEYGGEVRAVSWLGRKHAPDVLCLFRGWHAFIETKAPGGKPRPGQDREHARMRNAGCLTEVITTLEELDAWLCPLI